MENLARPDVTVDDNVHAGPFVSEFDEIGMEYVERPVTKRVSHPRNGSDCVLTCSNPVTCTWPTARWPAASISTFTDEGV